MTISSKDASFRRPVQLGQASWLKWLTEQLPAVLWTTDGYLKFTSSSGSVLPKLGLDNNQVVGMSLQEFFQTDDPDYPPIASHFKALRGESVDYIYEFDGLTFHTYLEPLHNEEKQIIGVVGLALDITDEIEATRKLELSQFTIDHSSNLIFWVDPDGSFQYVNEQAVKSLKRTKAQLDKASIFDVDPSMSTSNWEEFLDRCSREGQLTFETELTCADGSALPVEVLMNYFDVQGREFCCLFGRDITARRQMEEQLRLSQKMDALGRLAGGVAHDFNNQLSGIIVAAELIENMDDVPEDIRHYVELILIAAQHSSEITQQLLAFARKGESQVEDVAVNHIVEEALQLLHLSLATGVEIRQSLCAEDLFVSGEASQLQNAFLNMGLNSRDAMPDGGSLTFTTSREILAAPLVGEFGGAVDAGPCVKIVISDTGSGMTPEVLEKAFDPFFTTKEAGKGTGLGLAAVRSIIVAHGGALNILSKPGQGTDITITLPLIAHEDESPPVEEPEEEVLQHGHILVADDNDMIRDITRDLLERMGYQVTLAFDAKNALEVYGASPDKYDLVMLDMIMPRMTTPELFAEIRGIRDDARVLLISGYTMDEEVKELLGHGAVDFIQKPFHLKSLKEKVVSCLRAESD